MSSQMTAEELRDFVLRFFDMANEHDFDRMQEFTHETVIVNGVPVARPDMIAQFHGYATAVPDLTWDIQDLLVDGDRVAVRLTDSGTPVAQWLGLEPTGAAVSFTETAFYRIRDGRLEAMTFLVDFAALQQQLAG